MCNPEPIHVVAAVLKKDGRFLVCQRPKGKANALLWEFPGGKIEPGETGEAALRRECQEELDIRIQVESLLDSVPKTTPQGLRLLIDFYAVSLLSGTPRAKEHNALRWAKPTEIAELPFCPADETFLKNQQSQPQ